MVDIADWPLVKQANSLVLYVEVKPGAAKTEIVAIKTDDKGLLRLVIKLTAQAHEGAANKALIEFVSRSLKIPKSKIEIESGLKSRHKTLLLSDTKR